MDEVFDWFEIGCLVMDGWVGGWEFGFRWMIEVFGLDLNV